MYREDFIALQKEYPGEPGAWSCRKEPGKHPVWIHWCGGIYPRTEYSHKMDYCTSCVCAGLGTMFAMFGIIANGN